MADKAINKVVYGNQTLIDLTGDTAVENKVLDGYTFHKADGNTATGTCTFDADTKDATAGVAEVLATKTFYKNGSKLTGTMPNIGKQTGSVTTKAGTVAITQGYHDGSGSIGISSTEQSKIVPTNIRQGITILGVLGTMSGTEDVKATAANVTPKTTAQTITPSSLGDFNYISQVNVAAIAYSSVENEAGGLTVTIGTVAS